MLHAVDQAVLWGYELANRMTQMNSNSFYVSIGRDTYAPKAKAMVFIVQKMREQTGEFVEPRASQKFSL